MTDSWYPEQLVVGPEGTPETYEFMEKIYCKERHLTYAEFGIYNGDTARNVCERFPNCTLHLFDFHANIEKAKKVLSKFQNKIYYYGNTQKYNDSYNWSLMTLMAQNQLEPLFDYCFLDGAHTFAIDALNFFLCDRILKVGGYIDFDDYGWTLSGSSLDPQQVPAIAEQYTEEQINSRQVAIIVEGLVKTDSRYIEIEKNKIFQKIRP